METLAVAVKFMLTHSQSHFSTAKLEQFTGSLQPFPSLSHFSVLPECKLQQGGLFALKASGNLKAGQRASPGMRVGSRFMFQISSHHMKIPHGIHQSLTRTTHCNPVMVQCISLLECVWVCLIYVSNFDKHVSSCRKELFWVLIELLDLQWSDLMRYNTLFFLSDFMWLWHFKKISYNTIFSKSFFLKLLLLNKFRL